MEVIDVRRRSDGRRPPVRGLAAKALAAVAVIALVVAACGDGDASDDAAPTTTEATTTTSPGAVECDPTELFVEIDVALERARLEPGDAWDTGGVGDAAFADRTRDGDEVRRALGLDCSVTAVQRTDAGAERLLVAAWTGSRFGAVVQATDGPSTPYAPEAVFDLLIEWTRGEHIELGSLWAATMEGGESIVLRSEDVSSGALAKSWQSAIPEPDDAEISIESEEVGIEALLAVGGRNVSVAAPPDGNLEMGMIQAVSPTGQMVIAYVTPTGRLDPMEPWISGPSWREVIGGSEVQISTTGPDAETSAPDPDYGWIIEMGWSCREFDWKIESGFGTVDELRVFVTAVLEHLNC